MSDKIVPIVYSVNNQYAPYMYISLQSLIVHTSDSWTYKVYILYTDLEKRHIERLKSLNRTNIEVLCIDISRNMKGIAIKNSNYVLI